MVALPQQPVAQRLDAWLVADGGMRIGLRCRRLGRILAAPAAHPVEFLRRLVVRLEFVIADRPGRREAVLVPDLAEILLAQAEQHRAIDLAVAADEVVKPGVKAVPGRAVPGLGGLVARIDEDGAAVPILLLAPQVVATFEQQDALAGLRQSPGHRGAAGAGADDDDVVAFPGHRAAFSACCLRRGAGHRSVTMRHPVRCRRDCCGTRRDQVTLPSASHEAPCGSRR